ncbi:MAG: glycosyltransferase family 2 protein [Myxococcota bacterium]|nr:glycosyltransferase family 2 protein [Myxococcota bacterium]
MSSDIPALSLFIPFFNEMEALPVAVAEAREGLAGVDHEILLVDDGSRDGSGELADRLAEEHEAVRVIHHPENRKYGGALTTGFREARGRVVCYSDADLPVEISAFVEALPLLEDHDLVVGYPTNMQTRLRRQVYTRGYWVLASTLLGLRVRNINFSFKLLRRELVDRLTLGARTGFVDAQLLAEARRLDARVAQVPIEARPRRVGVSHFDSIGCAVETGVELVGWWWNSR